MGRRNVRSTGGFWVAVCKAALCPMLAGLALAVMWGGWHFNGAREPFVDFSSQVPQANNPEILNDDDSDRLRFAVATMVSAEATFSTYQRLVYRICRDVGRKEAFIVRASYADVRESLEQGNIDVALVCTGTYVHSLRRKRIKLLAQPVFEEPLEYRCLMIVPAKSNLHSLEDLRGRVMAFTDPESNTGCIVPQATLISRGHNPKTYFDKMVFTGSHDRSILAVATSVVDAAAVDSLIWESKLREDPSLAKKVRVIWQSEAFGPPPIVVPVSIDPALAKSLQEAMLALDKDDEGREILSAIGIKRFVRPQPESYLSAIEMYGKLQQQGDQSWP